MPCGMSAQHKVVFVPALETPVKDVFGAGLFFIGKEVPQAPVSGAGNEGEIVATDAYKADFTIKRFTFGYTDKFFQLCSKTNGYESIKTDPDTSASAPGPVGLPER